MSTTSFLFLGESKEETELISDMMSKRFPAVIPKRFIKFIDIISESKNVRIKGSELRKDLNLEDTRTLFKMFDISPGVHTVEITIDYPNICSVIKNDSEQLFANVFLG